FGSIAHGVGNLGFLTPGGVLGPIFWKKQITVDDGREAVVPARRRQMHRDNAIVNFARVATVLPTDSWSLTPFLRVPGLVDNADAIQSGMITRHNLLGHVAHSLMIPVAGRQKQLERAFVHVR